MIRTHHKAMRHALGPLALALLVLAPPAHAQVPPNQRWLTFSTDHLRLTFSPGLEAIARHAAERAEASYTTLARAFGSTPDGPVDILLTDNVDFANGYALPFPSNRIVVFAKPPIDNLALAYTRDWIELVVAHELTHIFHLDRTGRVGRALRDIFGRLPSGWPMFPAVGTPQWSIEGLATFIESDFTGAGRVHGSFGDMVLRTAALRGELDVLDEVSGFGPVWPAGLRAYLYGSEFYEYLARTYGEQAHRELLGKTASAIVPPPLAFDRVAKKALGRSFSAAFRDWRAELVQRYEALADSLRALGLTTSERLTTEGRYALFPRLSPDGARLAFTGSNGREDPATLLLDVRTRGLTRLARRNQDGGTFGPAAWLPDGQALVTAQFEFRGNYYIFQDLYELRTGRERRLTRAARLSEPDVARDGRVVAVQTEAGTNRLVIYDVATGALRPITPFEPGTHWALPRWAPDGARIAAGVWRQGGDYDVAILDTLGRRQHQLTRDRAIDAAPAWSPDGRYLLFWSERTGIPNLFAADLEEATTHDEGAALYQVSNVLTGALYPEIAPDGRWIYFSAYDADGFHIERMPFEPASWRRVAQQPIIAAQSAVLSEPADAADALAPAQPYSAAPTLRPYFWLPVVLGDTAVGVFYGALTFGEDLVGRHSYSGWLAGAGNRRFQGSVFYSFAGLGNPVLSLSASRFWESEGNLPVTVQGDTSEVRLLSREDDIALSAILLRRRWRSAWALIGGPQYSVDRFLIEEVPQGVRLRDPKDELIGFFARLAFANYRAHAFSISREDGVAAQIGARRLWERSPLPGRNQGYHELTAWSAAYKNLGAPGSKHLGYANHTLALRASALARGGPGADVSSIGGASGALQDLLVTTIGIGFRFLPVRGFDSGAQRGTHAWTASLEYRLPVALIGRGYRLWPAFLDRLSGSLFLDAGHAWCTSAQHSDTGRFPGCRNTARIGSPDDVLIGAGTELALDLSVLFAPPFRLRAGIGVPVSPGGNDPQLYLVLGPSF